MSSGTFYCDGKICATGTRSKNLRMISEKTVESAVLKAGLSSSKRTSQFSLRKVFILSPENKRYN